MEARILNDQGQPARGLICGASSVFEMRIRNTTGTTVRSVHVSVGIENALGQRVTTWSTTYAGGDFASAPEGEFGVRIRLPRLALLPGTYKYYLFSTVNGDVADWLLPAGSFEVEAGDFYGTGQLPGPRDGTFITEHAIELAH